MMSTETSVVSRNNKTKQKNAKKNQWEKWHPWQSCENRMQVADTVRILNVMHQFFSIYSSMVEGDGLWNQKRSAGACRNFSHPTLYCKTLFLFVLMGYITRMKIPSVPHIQWCAVPAISKIQLCFSALHKISKRGNKNEKGESHVKRLKNVNHLSSRDL